MELALGFGVSLHVHPCFARSSAILSAHEPSFTLPASASAIRLRPRLPGRLRSGQNRSNSAPAASEKIDRRAISA